MFVLVFYFFSNRPSIGYHADRDDTPDLAPPRFIEVEKGKICLGPPPLPPKECLESPTKDKVSFYVRYLLLKNGDFASSV